MRTETVVFLTHKMRGSSPTSGTEPHPTRMYSSQSNVHLRGFSPVGKKLDLEKAEVQACRMSFFSGLKIHYISNLFTVLG